MRAGGRGRLLPLVLIVGALAASAGPGSAAAATILNGGFETGNFQGWHVTRATEAGDWFTYAGTTTSLGSKRSPVTKVPKPPQGQFAAMADQSAPESLILWQDIALEPGLPHSLGLDAFYKSSAPLASPQTLSVDRELLGESANQQFRIDLIRPDAPLDSVAPPEVLANLFQTKTAGAEEMAPTRLGFDLTPFAGQTVRLRIAVAATGEPGVPPPGRPVVGIFNAGIDAVSVDGSDPNTFSGARQKSKGGSGPAGLRFGRSAKNRAKGTVTLSVRVPEAGTLTAAPAGQKRRSQLVKTTRIQAKSARAVKLTIRPTDRGRSLLETEKKIRTTVGLTFVAAAGGAKLTAKRPVVLELQARHHRR